MGTLYQNAISCPRLRIAMSEDPATSSSFKWVTLPKLIDFFGTECFCSRTFVFTARPESMPALKKELATRLGDETMQIADMYSLFWDLFCQYFVKSAKVTMGGCLKQGWP